MKTYEFTFPSFIRPEFDKKLEKLNKKLDKITNAIKVTIVKEDNFYRYVDLQNDINHKNTLRKIHVAFSSVSLSIPLPSKINGFSYIGTINMKDNVKTIYCLDNKINLTNINTKLCHHCNTNRKRNSVHVVKELTTNELHVISSACIENYIGININFSLKVFYSFFPKNTDNLSEALSEAIEYDIDTIIKASLLTYCDNPQYIKTGYMEHGNFHINKNSTKNTADNYIQVLHDSNMESTFNLMEKNNIPNISEIKQMLLDEFFLMEKSENNFISNVIDSIFYEIDNKRILKDFIVGKSRGLFYWAVYHVINKYLGVASEPKKQNSKFVGRVGENISFNGIVQHIRPFNNNYGSSLLVETINTDGNIIKFFTTSKKAYELQKGQSIDFSGTIHKHENYKSICSTIIKKPKFDI